MSGAHSGDSRQSRHAGERTALRVHNPSTQGLLDQLREAVGALRAAVDNGDVDCGDVLGVAAQVHEIGEQVRGVHYAVVGMADASGWWGVAGYTSTNAWLRHTHLLGARGAHKVSVTARWLGNQPEVAAALADGDITEAHVQAMRAVVTASPARAAAFAAVAGDFVTIAQNADAEFLARVMRSWGDTVDEQASDDDARRSHEKRGLFLSPVGDGWDIRGWLSGADGAELAGLLNERVAQTRRDNPDLTLSASQRRADALLDLARAAAAGGYSPAARDRAKVLVLVPVDRMNGCHGCATRLGEELLTTTMRHTASPATTNRASSPASAAPADPADPAASADPAGPADPAGLVGGWSVEQRGGEPPDVASAQWRTGNGTGRGHLAMSEVHRLSCDGQIQRVVLSPQSAVLDVGRTQRLVTPAMRTALEVRDGGCVIPGCDRPPGWCEAHHITHWSAGGETSLPNLVLSCSRHHHEIHQEKWRVRIDQHGQPQVSQSTRLVRPVGREA